MGTTLAFGMGRDPKKTRRECHSDVAGTTLWSTVSPIQQTQSVKMGATCLMNWLLTPTCPGSGMVDGCPFSDTGGGGGAAAACPCANNSGPIPKNRGEPWGARQGWSISRLPPTFVTFVNVRATFREGGGGGLCGAGGGGGLAGVQRGGGGDLIKKQTNANQR